MLIAPVIDPIALKLGPVAIHWYGLMYLCGFMGAWWAGRVRAGQENSGWRQEEVGDLIFYGAIGVIVGGRLGYVLFYNPAYYLSHPLEIFYVWTGGMSFHGGLLGVVVAEWLYSRHTQRSIFNVADFVAVFVPIGLFFGRVGNFINQELWGKVSDVPWAMVFRTGGPQARHPTQLYEAALEGLALFLILWFYSSKPRASGAVAGLFCVAYGFFRILVEFVRVPDSHLGYLAGQWLTMGQVLSLPLIVFGFFLMYRHRWMK